MLAFTNHIDEIVSHLGAALSQAVATDDPIIIGHARSAHEIAKVIQREMRAAASAKVAA